MISGKKITVWVAEVLSLVFLLAAFLPLIGYANVPEIIPTHFDFFGKADDWNPKSHLWLLPVVSAAFYLIFTILSLFPGKTYRFNGKKRQNDGPFIALTLDLMRYLKLIFTALFAYMANISAGFIGSGNLSPWIMWGLIALMGIAVLLFTIKAVKAAN